MEWIMQFLPYFGFPAVAISIALFGGYVSDGNLSSHPKKKWDTKIFLFIPAVGLLFSGSRMAYVLIDEPFVFECWWTAITFIVISAWLFYLFLKALPR